jgi:LPXTG-motif cell wall-anchored protein
VVPGIKGKVQVNALNEIEDEKENNDKIYFVFAAGLLLSFISLLFLSKKKKKIKDEKT